MKASCLSIKMQYVLCLSSGCGASSKPQDSEECNIQTQHLLNLKTMMCASLSHEHKGKIYFSFQNEYCKTPTDENKNN